jgi:hypothetical protein
LKPLLLEEVAEKHKTIEETHAGISVTDDPEKAKKMHLAEIADLRAREQKEKGEMRELMREEREEREAALAKLASEKRGCKVVCQRAGLAGSGAGLREDVRGLVEA